MGIPDFTRARAIVVTNLRSKQSASKRDQVQICVPSDRRYANDAQSAKIFARLRLFAGRILCCCIPRLHLSCAALSPNKGANASHALFFANLSGRFCAICVSASSDGTFTTAPLARDTEGCHRVCCRPHIHSWPPPHIVFVPRWIAGSALLIFPAPLLCTFSCCSFFAHHPCFSYLHPPPMFPRRCSMILSHGASSDFVLAILSLRL